MRFLVVVLALVASLAAALGVILGVGLLRIRIAEHPADPATVMTPLVQPPVAATAAPATAAAPDPMTSAASRPGPGPAGPFTTVVLAAGQATLHGAHLKVQMANSSRAERTGQRLTGWREAGDFAQWTFEPAAAGRYEINVVYTCPAEGGGDFTVTVGEHELAARSQPTRAQQMLTIGIVDLPAKKLALTLQIPGATNRPLMFLKEIRLVPAT